MMCDPYNILNKATVPSFDMGCEQKDDGSAPQGAPPKTVNASPYDS